MTNTKMQVLCGDPYTDWEKVKTREDIEPYLSHRDEWFTQVVKDEVLAKHHRALLIMGSGRFLRGQEPKYVEPHLKAGAKTYLIVFGIKCGPRLRRSRPSVRFVALTTPT